jgi:hypothetical protein
MSSPKAKPTNAPAAQSVAPNELQRSENMYLLKMKPETRVPNEQLKRTKKRWVRTLLPAQWDRHVAG